METSEVVSISEVTGRFDIMIKVYAKNLEALHSVVIEKIGKIEGIHNTETFVELQKTDKDNLVEIEKVIRRFTKNGEKYVEVKWRYYPNKFNSIILAKNVKNI